MLESVALNQVYNLWDSKQLNISNCADQPSEPAAGLGLKKNFFVSCNGPNKIG